MNYDNYLMAHFLDMSFATNILSKDFADFYGGGSKNVSPAGSPTATASSATSSGSPVKGAGAAGGLLLGGSVEAAYLTSSSSA